MLQSIFLLMIITIHPSNCFLYQSKIRSNNKISSSVIRGINNIEDGTTATATKKDNTKSVASFKTKTTTVSHSNNNNNNPSSLLGTPLSEGVIGFNRGAVGFLKGMIFDNIFKIDTSSKNNMDILDQHYARFYALETIARVPYFAYVSVLHYYETIGVWRQAEFIKLHFAESWNEHHHLLIMEELGGSKEWYHRFIAQHIAVMYYWLVLALYIANPTMAYNLNHAIEEHAFTTYQKFLIEYEDLLQSLPPPQAAIDYYHPLEMNSNTTTNNAYNMYMFDAMHIQTHSNDESILNMHSPRRPRIDTLYDAFAAVRDDEAEHVKTMAHLQTGGAIGDQEKNEKTPSTTITSTTTDNKDEDDLNDIIRDNVANTPKKTLVAAINTKEQDHNSNTIHKP